MSALGSLIGGALAVLRSVAGVPIEYRRGTSTCQISNATLGKSQITTSNDDGAITVLQSSDFMFAVSDLVIDDTATLPQAGDKIAVTIEGVQYVYRLLPSGYSDPYDYSDMNKTQLRVHTLAESQANV